MSANNRDSVIWSVYDPSIYRTSYIMGTMHLKDHNAYTFAALAEKYLAEVDAYAGEMHLDDAADADLHRYFQLAEGQDLSDYYTVRQYKRMSHIFHKITGAKLEQVSNLKPMAISNIIAESYAYNDYGLALDHHLWNKAAKSNKNLYGLESVEDQINILESVPMNSQVLNLKQTLKNITKYGKSIEALGELYAKGRIHKLYRKSKKSLGSIKNLMLYDRNSNMVDHFVVLHRDESLFAAVGAAHLSGKYGMLHLLNKKGIVIRPIYK